MGTDSLWMVKRIELKDIKTVKMGLTAQQLAVETINKDRLNLDTWPTASGLWDLAERSAAIKEHAMARNFAREVLAIDGSHKEANELLGNVFYDGQWMSERRMHLAKGEVYFEGRWMKPAEKDEIVYIRERKKEDTYKEKKEQEREEEDRILTMRLKIKKKLKVNQPKSSPVVKRKQPVSLHNYSWYPHIPPQNRIYMSRTFTGGMHSSTGLGQGAAATGGGGAGGY